MSEQGTAVQEITIQDWLAKIPAPYLPGHSLNENEASAVNQLFAENIRNNFAKKVKDARDEAKKNGGEVDFGALQSALDEYSASYTFGTRKGGGGGDSSLPKDPVQRAAHIIARDKIRAHAKAKGKKLTPEQVAELVPQLIEKNPSILVEAQRQVEAEASITIEDLELPEEVPVGETISETDTSGEGSADGASEETQPRRKRKG